MVCGSLICVIQMPWTQRLYALWQKWYSCSHQLDGKDVYVWFGVIENSVVMRLMLAIGVDGLMVDDPVALAEIYGH
jgi:hypothetical protein